MSDDRPLIGRILVGRLRFDCIIGILPQERLETQPLEIDIELTADFRAAARSDRIDDTADYAAVADRVRALAVENRYELVETLVADACRLVLDRFPGVQGVKITARKPQILPDCEFVGASLELTRV